MMDRNDKGEKYNWLLCAAVTILMTQVIFLVYTNLFCIPDTMDNDSAKVFVHAMEMWKNKTAFIPSWSNMTTLELDCSLLLAVPIYGLCHNIFVSFGLSNLILASFTAYIFYRIMHRMQVKKSEILMTIVLLFIPYSFGQLLYYNMTFFAAGQYGIKALVPILMIDVLSGAIGGGRKPENTLVLRGFNGDPVFYMRAIEWYIRISDRASSCDHLFLMV